MQITYTLANHVAFSVRDRITQSIIKAVPNTFYSCVNWQNTTQTLVEERTAASCMYYPKDKCEVRSPATSEYLNKSQQGTTAVLSYEERNYHGKDSHDMLLHEPCLHSR